MSKMTRVHSKMKKSIKEATDTGGILMQEGLLLAACGISGKLPKVSGT